jgi:UDPglucose 6-dehydrogenase
VRFLVSFGRQHDLDTPLFTGVLESNDAHKGWTRAKVQLLLGDIAQPVVAVLGLTYKPGTSTLRRSAAVELCEWLHDQGARVQAHDPAIQELPDQLRSTIHLASTPLEALRGADLAIVATEWPDYRSLEPHVFTQLMRRPQIIDQNWFLAGTLANSQAITYVATGRAPLTDDQH